jgi:hypothetical protein
MALVGEDRFGVAGEGQADIIQRHLEALNRAVS